MRTGTAQLPLHGGKCPAWLFSRMQELGAAIAEVVVCEFGPQELLRRLADPYWFQALGCVLGFDWHSSGLTTTLGAALKEGLRGKEKDLGIFIAGGKGRASRKTPVEIAEKAERWAPLVPGEKLIYASKMAAKVDNTALQDGYQLYHHLFIFTASGEWAVVQQGMNETTRWARRYHWLGEKVADFVCEPHAAVCCDRQEETLNMVAAESLACREAITSMVAENPEVILLEYRRITAQGLGERHLWLPGAHAVPGESYLHKALLKVHESGPANFAQVLEVEGVGPQTMRALALVAEVAYGAPPSRRDPVRYTLAHGGKDGHPFPVDRTTYDHSIRVLRRALESARIGRTDKLQALRKLASLYPEVM